MAKSSVAFLAASMLAFSGTNAQVYTADVMTGPSAEAAAATYTVTEDTGSDVCVLFLPCRVRAHAYTASSVQESL